MRRTAGAVAAVLIGLLMAVVPGAGPASAHEGKLKLEVAGDGATGVTVQAKYADGHALETVVRLVVNATASNGTAVGPVQLEPAGEGQGFYSTGPILTPGDWRVTVRAPAPYTGEATVAVRAKAAQTPPPAAASAPADSASSWPVWLIGGIVLAAVAGVALLLVLLRRGRRRPA